MSLDRYNISHYRAFNSAEMRVAPLTLLFGYNSAGKSALLRWLPILRDSLDHSGTSPINMASSALRGMSFHNLLSRFGAGSAISFGVSGPDYDVQYKIRDLPDRRTQIVESMTLTMNDEPPMSLNWSAQTDKVDTYLYTDEAGEREVQVTFDGLFPSLQSDRGVTVLSAMSQHMLRRAVDNTHWLQANRAIPPRKESYRPGAQVTCDGSGITQLLYEHDLRGSDIITSLSDWFNEAMGVRIVIQKGAFSSDELFSFCVQSSDGLIELADTGEGTGQVLSIVGLLLLAERGLLGNLPTLVFEHPELHLHAAAEPALADLLCRVAASGKAKIITETHSESFLLALQLSILRGQLSHSDVLVYWVQKEEGQASTLQPISFDANGRPEGGAWPPGVFNERADLARKVLLARGARTSYAG